MISGQFPLQALVLVNSGTHHLIHLHEIQISETNTRLYSNLREALSPWLMLLVMDVM